MLRKILFSIVLSSLLLVGCASPQSKLIGTWKSIHGGSLNITFYADGSWVSNEGGGGTYTIQNDDHIILSSPVLGAGGSTFTVDGDTLTLKYDGASQEDRYERVE